MSLSRPAFALAVALLAAAPSTAAAQATTPASLQLTAAGKRALKPSKLTLSSPKLTVGTATVGTSAKVALGGSLRFKAGKRSVRATRLALTVGRTSSYVSARLGKKQLRLLKVTPTRPASLDPARNAVTLTAARIALSRPAAKALRTALRLKRTPSTKTLGKLSVSVRPVATTPGGTATPQPAPAPVATPGATATPQPSATPTPTPAAPCGELFAATPPGSLDWFSCDLPGAADLKSWTNYLQLPFPAPENCPPTLGSITASGGAARINAASPYDHRFTITEHSVAPDGSTTIRANGTITYRMAAHGIEESVGPLRIVIAADGRTGTVFADGTAKARDNSGGGCAVPATPYTDQPVLTLDLSAVTPTTGDVTRWVHVPAKIAPGHAFFGGGTYPAGTSWGSFTIAVPAR